MVRTHLFGAFNILSAYSSLLNNVSKKYLKSNPYIFLLFWHMLCFTIYINMTLSEYLFKQCFNA